MIVYLNPQKMFLKQSKRQKGSVKATTSQVRFDQTVTIFHVPHHECLTPEEASLLWYQDSDYQRIDDKNDKILDEMVAEENQGSKRHYCARGLELRLGDRSLTIETTRQALWDAVLDEQFLQWRTGVEDPEAIAKVSREISTHPFERIAQLRGVMDEKEAFKIHFNAIRDELKKEDGVEEITTKLISTSDSRIKNNKKIPSVKYAENHSHITTAHVSLSPTSRRRSSFQMYQKKKLQAMYSGRYNDCNDIPSVITIPRVPLSPTCRRRSSLKMYEKKKMEESSLSFSVSSSQRALAYFSLPIEEEGHNRGICKFLGMTSTRRSIVWET